MQRIVQRLKVTSTSVLIMVKLNGRIEEDRNLIESYRRTRNELRLTGETIEIPPRTIYFSECHPSNSKSTYLPTVEYTLGPIARSVVEVQANTTTEPINRPPKVLCLRQ